MSKRRLKRCVLVAVAVVACGGTALVTSAQTSDAAKVVKRAKAADPPPTPEKANARIQAALDQPAHLEFIETPLNDVVEFLIDRHEIPIQLDRSSDFGEGLDSATPITFSVSGISLRSALKLLLEPLGLTAIIRNEVLYITMQIEADQELSTRHYRVADLVVEGEGTMAELTSVIRTTIAPTKWRSDKHPKGTEHGKKVKRAPAAWNSGVTLDGAGRIQVVGKTLIILQSEQVHESIAQLLRDLRAKE